MGHPFCTAVASKNWINLSFATAYRCPCVVIINTKYLCETLSNKSCLVSFDLPCCVLFNSEYPLVLNYVSSFTRFQLSVSYLIPLELLLLILHGQVFPWLPHNFEDQLPQFWKQQLP
jgi:hypothetical protein